MTDIDIVDADFEEIDNLNVESDMLPVEMTSTISELKADMSRLQDKIDFLDRCNEIYENGHHDMEGVIAELRKNLQVLTKIFGDVCNQAAAHEMKINKLVGEVEQIKAHLVKQSPSGSI